jgi:hypothetical protein
MRDRRWRLFSYNFIIDKDGSYIAHPDTSLVIKGNYFECAKATADTIDDEIGRRMAAGNRGFYSDAEGEPAHFEYFDFDGYNAWLDSKDGDEDYTFWNLQERIVAGAEFNLGSHLFLGAAGGIQFYQGGGDYESKRERLEDARLVENMDERADWRPTASLWFGPRLGESAGSLAIEYGVTFADKVKEWNTTLGISYFHPSGFHGTVYTNTNTSFAVSLGKSFSL